MALNCQLGNRWLSLNEQLFSDAFPKTSVS